MQLEVGMLGIESKIVCIVRIGMNPDRVLSPFEHTTQDSRHRTRSELGVGDRQHICLETRMSDVPIEKFCTPLGIEPTLIQILGLRCTRKIETTRTIVIGSLLRQYDGWFVGIRAMRMNTLLEVFPHVEHNATMIPPICIMSLGLGQVGFPCHNDVRIYGLSNRLSFNTFRTLCLRTPHPQQGHPPCRDSADRYIRPHQNR